MSHITVAMQRLPAFWVEMFWRFGERYLIAPYPETPSPDANAELMELRLSLIRKLLRRFPFWLRGHQRLAEMSLAIDDVATAYAAAQCVVAASNDQTALRGEGYLLLGRSFLRRREWRSSISYLDRADEILRGDPRISEERAAAFMAGGEQMRALELLEAIPAEQLSAAGTAALDFLRGRNK